MSKFPRLSLDSRLADMWEHPLGRDVLSKIQMQLGAPDFTLHNPLVMRRRLRTLGRAGGFFGVDEEFLEALVELLNANRDIPLDPSPSQRAKLLATPAAGEQPWWKSAVFYQIYPRSFADSNGDGIGDIQGIISKLDYLQDLGIDAVWLSPVYDSPNDDNGYDIRDYKKIMAEFGTLDDLDELIADLHARDMRLVMDLVVNHTSDEHEWFQQALADPQSPYRDYYFFRSGNSEQPPNNWTSFFSGPAWRYFEEQDVWALHLFSAKQMDLNWEHAPMREDIYEMVRWWLARGVDGFRLDVINYISKPADLPDGNTLVADLMQFSGVEHYFVGPRLHEHLRELRAQAFTPETLAIGETPGIGTQTAKLLSGPDRGELDMVFLFDHLETPGHTRFDDYEYDLEFLRDYLTEFITDYGATCHPALFFENHDNPRMISKVNPRPTYRRAIGRLLALIQLTLPGTPFIYQGQELGAVNEPFTRIDQLRDVESINRYSQLIAEGHSADEAFDAVLVGSRDHSRTPMAWTREGGFSTADAWLPSPADKRPNVAESLRTPNSVFAAYRDLIALRRAHAALTSGGIVFGPKARGLWSYVRTGGDGEPDFRVEANLTDRARAFTEPGDSWELVFATADEPSHTPGRRSTLDGYEGRLYRRRN